MDNKKILKFLYKDIAEIEEMVTEKGAEGFDEFEVEFIQSRFKGAKQLIQILSEKENKQLNKIRPRPIVAPQEMVAELLPKEDVKEEEKPIAETANRLLAEEEERLQSLSDFEEQMKGNGAQKVEEEVEEIKVTEANGADKVDAPEENEVAEALPEPVETEMEEVAKVQVKEQQVIEEPAPKVQVKINSEKELEAKVDLDEKVEVDEANHRLGDSFSKEKSVNELLGNGDSKNLEYKISNSPVQSIKTAIGINDRYQYIRELFDGSGDNYTKAVTDLDNMNSIQEAVTYLQQNYKWKKNDTSLKFVNLVKRRFPNG